MKALLIYSSKHGTTEKIADIIRHSSKHQIILNNLKARPKPDLSKYDFLIIGASIHAGKIAPRVQKFLKKNHQELLTKEIALYMCCMDQKKSEEQFNNNFPEEIRDHAFAKACVGGEFLFEKMNRLERAIVKKVSGQNATISNIKQDELQAFIHTLEV